MNQKDRVKEIAKAKAEGKKVDKLNLYRVKPIYKSKKFWAIVLSVLVPIANNRLGLNMDEKELFAFITGPLVYAYNQAKIDQSLIQRDK